MLFDAIVLIVVGMVVSFVNTIAGSGSFLSLPVLMMLGLSPQEANATNRLGIFFQTLVGVIGYDRAQQLDRKLSLRYGLVVIPGAILGSFLIIKVPEHLLNALLAAFMLFFAFLSVYKPDFGKGEGTLKPHFIHDILFFLMGVYGGAIQAGVGIFFLFGATLLLKMPLFKANALKLVLTFLFTPFSILIFMWNHQIDWLYGLFLAVGSVLGAWFSVRISLNKGEKFFRWFLFAILVISSGVMIYKIFA
ncbi:MAG: sulfite exporter TauE/SafE family protein [Bacteroidales bacterium]|nr:sulfite exporter TauE/SafE family protein [Bacteroidales bacterium]